ncbi:hypothetical protein GE21DRAFT_8471 [Neurospora crassa]|uniref:Uncharacterized protein n=2 Tax=Neurospora crassa TaxID=5141 RepID=Q1K5T9_NEUCR|nr:hypothetical protein NCU07209 [Neurospora crassa OR74A]EAA28198.1 hypothetical protein NCU07209 [Neurospora crassa OR74A]KHE85759.1 hypothetical protein GE21DRAFT_8471 [Neurospora crassa]CAD71073.1 hypothetical protein [Neurospora crassa]|eukprot:XP_957434.1 hypothetical protein NCU07209 [Neurospora crassa OR74A]
MPGHGGRNPIRWARTSAKKLVVDCHPAASGKREAELTAVFNDLAKQYQKGTHRDSGASAEQFHDHFLKSLRDMSNNLLPTAGQVANNAVIAVNTVNVANANSTALVKTNDTVNAVNANSTALVPANNNVNAVNPVNANSTALVPANNITMAPVPVPAPFNSTALVPANTTNMNPVAINNVNKRPSDNGQDSANKRSKTETEVDAPGTTTTFNINTNGPSTTRFHTGVYMAEFMLVGSGSVQVHSTGVPAFVQPPFVQQPAPAALAGRAAARAAAAAAAPPGAGSNQDKRKSKGKGKDEGDDSPSQRWHQDVPKLMVVLGGNEGLWYWL